MLARSSDRFAFNPKVFQQFGIKVLILVFTYAEGVNYEELDAKDPDTLTEVEKVALLGRPRLGDVTKIQIRIRESKEFKSSVDRIMQRGNASFVMGASSWKDQFMEAFSVQAGECGTPIVWAPLK